MSFFLITLSRYFCRYNCIVVFFICTAVVRSFRLKFRLVVWLFNFFIYFLKRFFLGFLVSLRIDHLKNNCMIKRKLLLCGPAMMFRQKSSGDPQKTLLSTPQGQGVSGGFPDDFRRDIIAGPYGMTRSRQYTIDGPNCMNFIPNYHTYFGALYFDLFFQFTYYLIKICWVGFLLHDCREAGTIVGIQPFLCWQKICCQVQLSFE